MLAVWDRVCTQKANVWIFRPRYVRTNYPNQHSHSRTAVRNSRREVDMNVHVVLYLRACTYRYRCLISKICVLLTQILLDMCIAVCLPITLSIDTHFVYQTIFSTCYFYNNESNI